MQPEQLEISGTLRNFLRLGVVFLEDITNGPPAAGLALELEELCEELRLSCANRKPTELEAVARTRKLYRRIGMDPTRDRPSSERLLRRALKEQPLPRINRLVDCINLVSLKLQCPLGLYDWDTISPPVAVRVGRPGEEFKAIHDRSMNLEGRFVCVDREGPFGNPSHDSHRTRVTSETRRALAVCWSPSENPRRYINSVLEEITRTAGEYCGARLAASAII